ncbi:hypothetical protein Ciccas_012007 [Cichlidogyrus casuarinus]|uniref:Uncharacterized protein n=1 Tax=Cichlidogyrus casuarinus TaxID=1844966 RepID=A0ABD2PRV2_9PLAT
MHRSSILLILLLIVSDNSISWDLKKSQCSVGRNKITGFVSASCVLVCLKDIWNKHLAGVNELLIRVVDSACVANLTLQAFTSRFPGLRKLRILSPNCDFKAPISLENLGLQTLELFGEGGSVVPYMNHDTHTSSDQLQKLWIHGRCLSYLGNHLHKLPHMQTLILSYPHRLSNHLTIEGQYLGNRQVLLVPRLQHLIVTFYSEHSLTVRNLPSLEKLSVLTVKCDKQPFFSNLPKLRHFISHCQCKNKTFDKVNCRPQVEQEEMPQVPGYLTMVAEQDDSCVSFNDFYRVEINLTECKGMTLLEMLERFRSAQQISVEMNDTDSPLTGLNQSHFYEFIRYLNKFHLILNRYAPDAGQSKRAIELLRDRLHNDPRAFLQPKFLTYTEAYFGPTSEAPSCIPTPLLLSCLVYLIIYKTQ